MNVKNMKDKKVLIVGLGKSGIAAAQAMLRLEAEVHIQDAKKEENVDPQLRAFLKERVQPVTSTACRLIWDILIC